MKTATIEDLQLHFSILETWLEAGESVEITREGKAVALLTHPPETPVAEKVTPFEEMSDEQREVFFQRRFVNSSPASATPTRIVDLILEERGT